MVSFEQTLRDALAKAKRDAVVHQLRATPEITIAELREIARGDLRAALDQVTIGDLIDVGAPRRAQSQRNPAPSRRRKEVAAAPAVAPATSAGSVPRSTTRRRGAGSKRRDVNTRTQDGRDAYDKAMLDALQRNNGVQMAAPEISEAVGGTPQQIRSSLARLIQAGKVTWTGQARGTRYCAV